MFHKGKVIAALEAKRDRFVAFEANLADGLKRMGEALNRLNKLSRPEIEARLAGSPWPGARPSAEFNDSSHIVIPFSQRWDNHEQAREWAMQILASVSTFAVDGSQVPPSKDFSVPVAAVQIGWFENPHNGRQPYTKAIDFEVLTPDEMMDNSGGFPDQRVNLRRFQGEVARLIERMNAAGDEGVKPVCFLDGSLIVSFVQQLRPNHQRSYIDLIVQLLETSQRTRVPLVGYVDTSYANDLITMLAHLERCDNLPPISDGALLRPRMAWGDRSRALICARDDTVLAQYGAQRDQLGCVYLKTTADSPPARLDFPAWLIEEGWLETVLNVVRAECVIGTGYPYAAETADAVAVITAADREQFYHTFQEFAEREGLALRYSRKALGKRRRR